MATAATQTHNLDYLAPRLYLGTTSSLEQDLEWGNDQTLSGFPDRYAGERVWTGSEIAGREHEYVIVLSEQDQDHVLKALRYFQSLNVDPQEMKRETFPLPQDLQDKLRSLSHGCYNGCGFGILRGLNPELFTEAENVLVFGGISTYVAPQRGFQDLNRELVTCHVVSEDTRPGAEEHNIRPAFTNGRLAFHTDLGEILALYAMNVATNGGKTMIVSSSNLYNELAKTRPDLLQELGKPWVFSYSQRLDTDGTPLVTNAAGDKLVFQYSRLPITGFRKEGPNPTLPTPSLKRLEAMSLLEDLAWKHCFPLPGKKGDIAYINNLTLMHARSPFDLDNDGRPLPSKRHLLKLMLRDPELAWELPESLHWCYYRVYGPNREDGKRVEEWQLTVDSNDTLPGGHIWAGSGSVNNG